MSNHELQQKLQGSFSSEAHDMLRTFEAKPSLSAKGIGASPGNGLINGQLLANGRPLRGCSVELPEGKYVSDANGQVWIPKSGSSVSARIWAATYAGRVLNGEKFNLAYTQDVVIPASGSVNVPDENNAFTLSQMMLDALQKFRNAFPRWKNLMFSDEGNDRIEVSWPDKSYAPLSFTEPTSATGFPLIHYVCDMGNYQLPPLVTVEHEYAHAIHFSLVPHDIRDWYKLNYIGWILSNPFNATHDYTKITSECVAWVEAWAYFATNQGNLGFVPTTDGSVIEGAIRNLVLDRFPKAASPSDPRAIQEKFILSQARTFKEFAAWIASNNPTAYQLLKPLAQSFHISLP